MTNVQVVGDSQPFSPQATAYAKAYLQKEVLESEKNMILWGYTGRDADEGIRSDANQMVTRYLEKYPKTRNRSLGNVVNYHSVKAMKSRENGGWGCKVDTGNQNFYLVYGDEDNAEKGAKFGDDVRSSDHLAEVFVCLEGGVQSFRQIVNALSRGIPVKGLSNLRGYDDPTFDRGNKVNHFSAAEFFIFLQEKLENNEEPTAKDIEGYKEEYWKMYELINAKNDDADTKPALFKAGWEQFMKEQLWIKLGNCSFQKFEPVRPRVAEEEKKN